MVLLALFSQHRAVHARQRRLPSGSMLTMDRGSRLDSHFSFDSRPPSQSLHSETCQAFGQQQAFDQRHASNHGRQSDHCSTQDHRGSADHRGLILEQPVMSQSQDRRHGQDQRLRELVLQQGDFVARSLRNLGVWGGELDDCVQKVFLVAARRLPEIELGKERAFLFSCAQNTAAHFRRSLARKREVSEDALVDRTDPELLPDQLADRKRYREILDQLLETMDENIRATFVLYSFEEMTMAEIADVLGVPPGTVASRLRRAREIFRQEMTRLKLFDQFRTDQLRTKQETA